MSVAGQLWVCRSPADRRPEQGLPWRHRVPARREAQGIQEDTNFPASPHLPPTLLFSSPTVPLSQCLGSPEEGVQSYCETRAGSSQRGSTELCGQLSPPRAPA